MMKTIWNYIWFAYARIMCVFNKHSWLTINKHSWSDMYHRNSRWCVICDKEETIKNK